MHGLFKCICRSGLERILRRFSIFAEEPCKSTITTTEPCSPLFKEAQPRPSNHNTRALFSLIQTFSFSSLIVLMFCNCYLFYNKVSSRIVLTSKGFSVFFWITLSPEVSRLSLFTHNHINIREFQEPSVYSLHPEVDIPLQYGKPQSDSGNGPTEDIH